MPTSVTVHKKGDKSVIVRSTGNEKSRVTLMLACLVNGTKLPPHLILKRKTVPKEAMPAGIIVRAQAKGWMETELVVDWLKVVWGRRAWGLRKRRNMLVLDAFRGHLTEPVKKQLKAMNGDLSDHTGRNDKSATESIVNGFKKCCISNAMDGSEDDVLWEEAESGDAQPEKVSDESDDSESGPSDAEDAAQ
ncbi:hypothetical protein AAFF_G00243770 [Aldrovandia affinis]|uniref:DDE-1 domain-containing protein n=1 Tax=Aldrovandia affinis TaxID=143900 RepID=A0AAD7QZR6_9TELE|nr:hypothetical protein AAFF_G00243770 [Aldrovandia affinis]